jgi:hypothetical protein
VQEALLSANVDYSSNVALRFLEDGERSVVSHSGSSPPDSSLHEGAWSIEWSSQRFL